MGEHLGDNVDIVAKLADGTHPFAKKLAQAKRPVVVVGSECLQRPDGGAILSNVQKLAQGAKVKSGAPAEWKVLNVLHRVASQVAALDIGYQAGVSSVLEAKPDVLYLPGAAYTEKQGTYVNTEGRSQQTLAALTPPGMARVDWKILRAISEVIGETLPYDTIHQIRARLTEVAPNLTRYGLVQAAQLAAADKKAKAFATGSPVDVKVKELEDFYMTNSISRASPTMAKCVTAVKTERAKKYFPS